LNFAIALYKTAYAPTRETLTIMPCVLMNEVSGNAIQRCGTAEELVRIGFPGNERTGHAQPLYLSPTDTLKMLFITKDAHMYGLLIVLFCFGLLAWYVLRLRKDLKEQSELTSRLSQRLDLYLTEPPSTHSHLSPPPPLLPPPLLCRPRAEYSVPHDVSLKSRIHSAAQKRQYDYRKRGLPKKN